MTQGTTGQEKSALLRLSLKDANLPDMEFSKFYTTVFRVNFDVTTTWGASFGCLGATQP